MNRPSTADPYSVGGGDLGTDGSIDSFNDSEVGHEQGLAPSGSPPDPERFELLGTLGAGGMGRVHLAWDRRLQREVAIKVPNHGFARDRFAREAAITARLEHHGIVSVFDAGHAADGTPWFVMPIVRGRSLATLIREADGLSGRLRLLRHVLAVAETLAFAHALGAVHRDLKPTNVMVGRFGETQVIDWGLAHFDGLGDVATHAGTPRYMAPAQAAGEPPSPGDDVYSLGALLFETVCGTPAFPAVQTVYDVVREAPRRASVPDEVPVELVAIIDRALASDRAHRYADALALAADLDNFLAGRLVGAHAYSRTERVVRFVRRWRLPLGVAGLALFVLVIGGAVSFGRIAEARDDAEENLSLALVTAANAALAIEQRDDAGRLARYALSLRELPDARGVLMALPPVPSPQSLPAAGALDDCNPVAADTDELRVLCTSANDADALSLQSAEGVVWRTQGDVERGGTFLGGGDIIALASSQGIDFRAAKDGARMALVEPACRGTLQPGSRTDAVLLFRRTCASVVRPGGETPMSVAVCGADGIAAAAIDADAKRFALACHDGTLHTWNLGTDGVATPVARYDAALTPPGLGVSAVAFVGREGPLLLVGTQQGSLLKVDMDTRSRLGKFTPGGYIDTIEVTPDGRFALIDQHIGPEVVIDVEAFAPVERVPDDVVAASLSPAGVRRLAGATLRDDASKPPLPRFTSMSHGVTSLAISPDGQHLAVGQSDWLTTVDMTTRRPLGRIRWQHEVVKSLDYAADGVLVAHGIGDEATLWFDDPTLGTPRREPLGSRARRILVMPDGSVLHGRWGAEGLRRVRGGVAVDEDAGPALVDFVGLDGGRVVHGIDAAGDVWRGENLHLGGRFERCGNVPGGLAMGAFSDGVQAVVLAMRAYDIIGVCGTEARFQFDAGDVKRDDAALTAFAAEAGWVVAGSRDGIVRLWRQGETYPRAIQRNHNGRVAAVAIDPQGRWFASGGWDAQVMFWSIPQAKAAADGQETEAPKMHELLGILRKAR